MDRKFKTNARLTGVEGAQSLLFSETSSAITPRDAVRTFRDVHDDDDDTSDSTGARTPDDDRSSLPGYRRRVGRTICDRASGRGRVYDGGGPQDCRSADRSIDVVERGGPRVRYESETDGGGETGSERRGIRRRFAAGDDGGPWTYTVSGTGRGFFFCFGTDVEEFATRYPLRERIANINGRRRGNRIAANRE